MAFYLTNPTPVVMWSEGTDMSGTNLSWDEALSCEETKGFVRSSVCEYVCWTDVKFTNSVATAALWETGNLNIIPAHSSEMR